MNSISEKFEKIKQILYPKNDVIEKVKLVKESTLFNMIYREEFGKNHKIPKKSKMVLGKNLFQILKIKSNY